MRVIHSKVVGNTFVPDGQAVLSILNTESELYLQREPQNEFDINAIAILAKFHHMDKAYVKKIGYINRELAKTVAPIIDAGTVVVCKVANLTGNGRDNIGCNILLEIEE